MEKDLPKGLPKPKMIPFCVCFKGPSNDAHRAITALQMAFSPHSLFTKDSVMKPFWKSVAGEGEGGWLLLPFDPIMSFTSRGRRRCNEEAPCPSPGFESVSSRIRSSPSASALSRGPRGQPATAPSGQESSILCWRRLPGMPAVPSQAERAFTKGQIPSDLSLLRSRFFLVTEKRDGYERLSVFSGIKRS